MSLSKAPLYLSKLQLHGNIWLAADIHLGPNSPKTAQAFYDFLLKARQEADALILCGDIFHAWVGSDLAMEPPGWLALAIQHFRQACQDIPIFFMRGNRDFLLDSRFARYVGAQLLDDQIILKTDLQSLVLTHGDELCTDDLKYQQFRQRVRNNTVQSWFLKLPLKWRLAIAGGLRQRSRKQQQTTSSYIGDVNEQSCIDLLNQHSQFLLIHGHTHRPAIHRLTQASGPNLTRIVLPDWEFEHSQPTRGGWLVLSQTGQIELHRLHQPTLRFTLHHTAQSSISGTTVR